MIVSVWRSNSRRIYTDWHDGSVRCVPKLSYPERRRWLSYDAGLMSRRVVPPVLLVLITLHGALLRLECLHAKYGWMERPEWVAAVESRAVPVARHLRPRHIAWGRVRTPYVGGDPINYLLFAREMQSFYQGHVREPVFLALSRGFLQVMQNKDVALSFASAAAGTLAIPATYLLGSLYSPVVGLAAAAALAIEFDAIRWTVDGWRDDTFMLFVTLATWAFIRLRRVPSTANVVLAGVSGALVCLTRISALSFVVPALLYAAVRNDAPLRIALRRAPIAAVITVALVLPYLINCARATGDPFFAVNYHTRYYRAAEQLAPDDSVGALAYLSRKFESRPILSADTALFGLVIHPYQNKWTGFAHWSRYIRSILFWSGIAGLFLATAFRDGRMFLLILITSLVPYAMTWPVGGGGEWRFTQHVYPLYLVAACAAIAAAVPVVSAAVARRLDIRQHVTSRSVTATAIVAVAVVVGSLWYRFVPLLTFRETIAAGEPANVMTGDRDDVFFPGPWSASHAEGAVVVRAALADRTSVRIPVPRQRANYAVTLRLDPAETTDVALQPKVTAYFNGRVVAQLHLSRQEERIGTYRVVVPRELTDWRVGRLDLVASHTVPAAEAGRRFKWLPPNSPVAFRLWYVRVEPVPASP